MLVKVCGLGTQEQVRAAVAAGADAIGFVFADSVRRVTPARAAEISKSAKGEAKRVAVMLHPSDDEWQQVLAEFGPDVLQTDADDFESLDVPDHIECWPVYRESVMVSGTVTATVSGTGTGAFVYEGARSGQGETVDWTQAAAIARQGRMILAGGLDASNVAEAIRTVRPYGVDVSSGVESAPGKKDTDLIREFIKAARAAEKDL